MVFQKKNSASCSYELSWLHDKNLPLDLWAKAIQYACDMINYFPPSPDKEKSSFKILYHENPNVNYFGVFDSTCCVYISKYNWTNFIRKQKNYVFVGYDSHRKGWRWMDPEIKKFITSRDVVFDEISSYNSAQKTNSQEMILDVDQ